MKISKDNLIGDYLGVVVDINDPECSGRCKIQVFNIMDNIPKEHLPWASPMGQNMIFASKGQGALSVPKVGHIVRVNFVNGNIYNPEYWAIQQVDTNLINEIKADYPGTHVILYDSDQELSVIFQPNSGFRIYYRGSYIHITPDNMITLNHANNSSIIQLQGETMNIFANNEINIVGNNTVNLKSKVVNVNGTESVNIKGSHPNEQGTNAKALMTLLESMATIIDQKLTVSPSLCAGLVNAAKPSIINTNINYV